MPYVHPRMDLAHTMHDDSPGPRAEFRAADVTVRFMLAGHAYVTFQSERTGTRFTYRIAQGTPRPGDSRPAPHFVAVLTGPDHYEYLGTIFNRAAYAHGRKSRIGASALSNVAFTWVWAKLSAGKMPHDLGVWHEGRCGVCSRRLTTPASIERGLGDVCARRLEGGAR